MDFPCAFSLSRKSSKILQHQCREALVAHLLFQDAACDVGRLGARQFPQIVFPGVVEHFGDGPDLLLIQVVLGIARDVEIGKETHPLMGFG